MSFAGVEEVVEEEAIAWEEGPPWAGGEEGSVRKGDPHLAAEEEDTPFRAEAARAWEEHGVSSV